MISSRGWGNLLRRWETSLVDRTPRTDLGEGVSSPLLGWSELVLGHPKWGPDRQED